MKRIRLFAALLLLAASTALLVWGYWPAEREVRIQEISPSEMQLPTPSSYEIEGLRTV